MKKETLYYQSLSFVGVKDRPHFRDKWAEYVSDYESEEEVLFYLFALYLAQWQAGYAEGFLEAMTRLYKGYFAEKWRENA